MPSYIHEALAEEPPEKRLTVREYWAPVDVTLKDGRLFWPIGGEKRLIRAAHKTFSRFVDLRNASDEDVLRFARRWGVLDLCKAHHLPRVHAYSTGGCAPLRKEGEPVSEWRNFANVAFALLGISQGLNEGELGKLEFWQLLIADDRLIRMTYDRLSGEPWKPSRKEFEEAKQQEKSMVSRVVNKWLQLGDVRPNMAWESVEPTIKLGPGSLFGALAVHLLELSGRYLIADCTGCRTFYHPTMRPKSGQDRYCQTCRDADVPVAMAKHRKKTGQAKPRSKKRAKTAR